MNFPNNRKVFLTKHIDKKRKIASDEEQNAESIGNLSVSDEMKNNIERTFVDQLKHLITNAEKTPQGSIISNSILAERNATVQKIPLYSKLYEESMMRPATADERPCKNNNDCECIQIALHDPSTSTTDGFVGVSLSESHNMCILCARKNVSQLFYNYLITNTRPTGCIQSHYNNIESYGEYSKNAVFLPTSMSGITDPIVMHLRHNYFYENQKIKQRENVNFDQASTRYRLCPIRKEHCTKKNTEANEKLFLKIKRSKTYSERFYYEMVFYERIPLLTNKKYTNEHSFAKEWQEITTTIFDGSIYLPILFGRKIQSDKSTKNVPIIHIISKGLPQRSQFRNFLSISLDCMDKSNDFKLFFKQLFVWSLTGVHYKWNKVCIPLHKRTELFTNCCVDDTNWRQVLSNNVRLFFFMIKEYLCFLVHQTPGLYSVLLKATEWNKYETEVFKIMNEVRSTFSACDQNPLKQMLVLSQKFLPRPNIVNWPKTRLNETSNTILQKQIVLYNYLSEEIKPIPTSFCETIPAYEQEYRRLQLCYSKDATLSKLIEKSEILNEDVLSMYNQQTISKDRQERFVTMIFIHKLLKSIKITALPIHQVETQIDICVQRHDLNSSDKQFYKSLSTATTYYFCLGCEDIKASYDYNQKKKENTVHSYGHTKLALDTMTGLTYCVGANSRRKQKQTCCMTTPCLKIPLLGNIVSFYGRNFTLCSLCGTLCTVKMNTSYLKKSMIACGNCCQNNSQQEFCGYCMRKSSSLQCYKMYDDSTTNMPRQNPWVRIWLCPRHRRNHWSPDKILLKSALFETLGT